MNKVPVCVLICHVIHPPFAAVLPPVLSLLSPQLRASVGAEVCFSAAAVDLPVALVCASVGVLTASPAGAGSGGEDPDTLRAHVVSQLLVKLDALAVERCAR